MAYDPAVGARLFVIPGSAPCMAARLMLAARGVDYRRTDLLSPVHRPVVRLLGFPGRTVPALKVDGQHVQTTGAIARWLDAERPGPRLVPEEPELRRRVEEAEAWADDDLQAPIRRIIFWVFRRDRSGVRSFLEGARLGLPTGLLARTAAPVIWAAGRANAVSDERVRADLAALPGLLDRVDELIEEGTIGGDELNVADYQVAGSIRLLMSLDDLRPALAERPLGRHALRVVPEFAGRVPPVLDERARSSALAEPSST